MRSKVIEVTVEAQIARAPQDVFAIVGDPVHAPDWLAEFREVVKLTEGPIALGSVFRYTIDPGGRSSTMTCVEWEPGRRFGWDGPPLSWYGGAARPRGYFDVTETAPGHSLLVCCFRPQLMGSMALLSPYMKWWLRKQRTADTAGLKALLQSP
jgi:uncharacterized protein YndB with AHSA1/START domain